MQKLKELLESRGFSFVVKNGKLTMTRPMTLEEVRDLILAVEGVNLGDLT